MSEPETNGYRNNSTVRTMLLLELLGKSGFPLPLSAITDASGLDKATVRRFLLTLMDLGYVERTESGAFRLTARILQLSSLYLRSVSLPNQAIPYLEQFCLETGAATSLGILDGTDAVYIAHVSAREALSVGTRIGSRLPAHATAIGKMLLSSLPAEEILLRYPKDSLPIYTARTIREVSLLIGALQEVQRQGWAVADEEYEPGVRAAACPIYAADGSVLSVMNVSTRTDVVDKMTFYGTMVPSLMRACASISSALRNGEGSKP